jgi:hypothetical protein
MSLLFGKMEYNAMQSRGRKVLFVISQEPPGRAALVQWGAAIFNR